MYQSKRKTSKENILNIGDVIINNPEFLGGSD